MAGARYLFCWAATDGGVEMIAALPSGPAPKRWRGYLVLRDGNNLAGKEVNADYHRFTHHVNLADRFASKGHAPDLAFVFDHLDRPDAFRFEVNALTGDPDGALAAGLLPHSL